MKKYNKKLILMLLIFCIACICSVSILTTEQEVYAATKIQLNKKSLTLTEGKSATLKLKGTKKNVKWTSSNKKIVTVNEKGKVTAKKAGRAEITAKIENKKYKCAVTVNAKKSKPAAKELAAPIVKWTLSYNNKLTLTWDKVKNAEGYTVWIYREDNKIDDYYHLEKRINIYSLKYVYNFKKEGDFYKIVVKAFSESNGQKVYGKGYTKNLISYFLPFW